MALQRPRKRLKRLSSPRHAEVADDLEDDLQDETLEDGEDEDEDFGKLHHSFLQIPKNQVI